MPPTQEVKQQPKVVAKAPDPAQDPAGYLKAHGWRHEGPAEMPTSVWYDPTLPDKPVEENVLIGKRKMLNGKEEEMFQTRVTPAAWGMSLPHAVAVQREREAAK